MKQLSMMLTAVLLLSPIAFPDDKKVLQPDRELSITSMEHRDSENSNRPYKVEGHTSGSKVTLYYKLACGTGAARLEVGHTYKAAEIEDEGNKILVLWYEDLDPKTNAFGVGCDITSVKTSP